MSDIESFELKESKDVKKILDEVFEKQLSFCLEKGVSPNDCEWSTEFEEHDHGNVKVRLIGTPYDKD